MAAMTTPRSHAGRLLTLLTAASLLTGCDGQPAEKPRYTHQQAMEMVGQNAQDAVAHLDPKPRLAIEGPGGDAPCSGPNDDKETGNVMYERGYRLEDVDHKYNWQLLDQLKRYWQANGYVIGYDDSSATNPVWHVVARDINTGFTLSLIQGDNGTLGLTTGSPCVPEPTTPLHTWADARGDSSNWLLTSEPSVFPAAAAGVLMMLALYAGDGIRIGRRDED